MHHLLRQSWQSAILSLCGALSLLLIGVPGMQEAAGQSQPMLPASSVPNGALAAAMTASNQAMESPKLVNGRSDRAHESSQDAFQARNGTRKISNRTGPATLQLPNGTEVSRSRSPSDIAAKLAAARYAPQKQRDLISSTDSIDQRQSRDQPLMENTEAPTDTTSIASTGVLVNMFERKSSARPREALTGSAMPTTNRDLLSPKPFRPLVGEDIYMNGADATGKHILSSQTAGETSTQPASNVLSAYHVNAQGGLPPKALNTSRTASRAPEAAATATYVDSQSQLNSHKPSPSSPNARDTRTKLEETSHDSFMTESIAPAPRIARKPPLPPPRKSSQSQRTSLGEAPSGFLGRPTRESPNNTRTTRTRSLAESNSLTTRGSSLGQGGSTPEAQPAWADREKWRRTPLNPAAAHLSEDSLANAIVASSLASSRAPSPTKLDAPPLPARHVKPQKVLYYQQHREGSLSSRTPSPAKGMRHTMRQPPPLDDEASSTSGGHRHGRRRLLKKHPNKHHEGDRKRWRDEVTERERKRYEGVWAANTRIPMSDLGVRGAPGENLPAAAGKATVLNVVVREIWLRSQLPEGVLEEIWNLVDNQSTGMLSREEFVVGMWLIDQRLKGRKLPVRVSDSIWASVRHPSGIKLQAI